MADNYYENVERESEMLGIDVDADDPAFQDRCDDYEWEGLDANEASYKESKRARHDDERK